MSPPMRTAIATFTVALVAVASLAWATGGFTALTSEQARRLAIAAQPQEVPDIQLTMADGETRTLHELLLEQPGSTIVGFFYAECRTICLTLASDFSRLQERLVGLDDHRAVRLLSISFAPDTDTPAALQAYAQRMGAQPGVWQLATANRPSELPALFDSFGLRVIDDGHGGYVHNSAFHIVNPGAKLVGIVDLGRPQIALDLARKVATE